MHNFFGIGVATSCPGARNLEGFFVIVNESNCHSMGGWSPGTYPPNVIFKPSALGFRCLKFADRARESELDGIENSALTTAISPA